MTDPALLPTHVALIKDVHLKLTWPGGRVSVYPVAYLRTQCPCAMCRKMRDEALQRPTRRLNVLPGNHTAGPVVVTSAETVGNYAIRLHWSDNHASGIYSYQYLHEIAPAETSG
jgi:DUF971 family protein